LGLILIVLGLFCTIGFSILCVINGTLILKALAIGSTLILAVGLTLFRPLQGIEEEP